MEHHARERQFTRIWTSVAVLAFFGMERVKGIEPSYEAWEAAVLPLNYTRSGVVPRHKTGAEAKIIAWVFPPQAVPLNSP